LIRIAGLLRFVDVLRAPIVQARESYLKRTTRKVPRASAAASRGSWWVGFDRTNKAIEGRAASAVGESLAHRMGRPWVPPVLGFYLHTVCVAHQGMRAEHVLHRNDLKPRRRQPTECGGDVRRPNAPR
jgi:hypothetical protein